MAPHARLPSAFRGIPARLAVVALAAGAFGGWAFWPSRPVPAPVAEPVGKHADRLAFSGDESEIPVREARIYDTLAMFSLPQAEPRPWSAAPVRATVREAGIRPVQIRPTSLPRLAAGAHRPWEKSIRVAAADPVPAPVAPAESVKVLGWDVPGSRHLPTRQDAAHAFGKVGSGIAAVGSGAARAVSRSASALGGGVADAGNALAETLGLR